MRRRIVVLGISIFAAFGFAAAFLYQQIFAEQESLVPPPDPNALVRAHSPVIGPANAPVTIVEFLDPACAACRAFHPVVKQLMAKHPEDVRLVIRYVLFHEGSDEAARILEAAHEQGVFVPALEAVLEAQPEWHGDPKVQKAWDAAGAAGLDLEKARKAVRSPEIDAVLGNDMADVKALGIRRTPTLFVNGRPLTKLAAEPLQELVQSELDRTDE